MNIRSSTFIVSFLAGASALGCIATGCELIAAVDDSLIAGVDGGTGSGNTAASSTSGAGGGGAGTSTAAGSGGQSGTPCTTVADCPASTSECSTTACTNGRCATPPVASGTPLAVNPPGTCQQAVCDGNGMATTINDDMNVPVSPSACITSSCVAGAAKTSNLPAGTACAMGFGVKCDANGNCVECLVDSDCTSTKNCQMGICEPATCTDMKQDGTETDVDCGGGSCPACASNLHCVQNSDCTSNACVAADGGGSVCQ